MAAELFGVVDMYDWGFIRWATRDEEVGTDEVLDVRIVPIDRVRVRSGLNGGRYNRRFATVLEVYGPDDHRKVSVQLDEWSRGFEPSNGVLYLELAEVLVEAQS